MLGPAKPRRLDQPIAASLEDLVPADPFYRHLEATLDLGFAREWVKELSAERGRPSIEPLFAEAKVWHGLRRFRLWRLDNVNSQGLLVAAGQNLKRWLAATGCGRRHAPRGSLMALPLGLGQPLPAWH